MAYDSAKRPPLLFVEPMFDWQNYKNTSWACLVTFGETCADGSESAEDVPDGK